MIDQPTWRSLTILPIVLISETFRGVVCQPSCRQLQHPANIRPPAATQSAMIVAAATAQTDGEVQLGPAHAPPFNLFGAVALTTDRLPQISVMRLYLEQRLSLHDRTIHGKGVARMDQHTVRPNVDLKIAERGGRQSICWREDVRQRCLLAVQQQLLVHHEKDFGTKSLALKTGAVNQPLL